MQRVIKVNKVNLPQEDFQISPEEEQRKHFSEHLDGLLLRPLVEFKKLEPKRKV
jgi:hypothetical protein